MKVSKVGQIKLSNASSHVRGENQKILSYRNGPRSHFSGVEAVNQPDSLLSTTTNCATLPAKGQRVSGPEVKVARRRYQKGSIRRRGNTWTLREQTAFLLCSLELTAPATPSGNIYLLDYSQRVSLIFLKMHRVCLRIWSHLTINVSETSCATPAELPLTLMA